MGCKHLKQCLHQQAQHPPSSVLVFDFWHRMVSSVCVIWRILKSQISKMKILRQRLPFLFVPLIASHKNWISDFSLWVGLLGGAKLVFDKTNEPWKNSLPSYRRFNLLCSTSESSFSEPEPLPSRFWWPDFLQNKRNESWTALYIAAFREAVMVCRLGWHRGLEE